MAWMVCWCRWTNQNVWQKRVCPLEGQAPREQLGQAARERALQFDQLITLPKLAAVVEAVATT